MGVTGDALCVSWLLSLSWSYSHSISSPNVTPLTNPAKVKDQGLCYCNSDTWGWHNSHQSSHQHNQSAYFPEFKKSSKYTGGTITETKPCHSALLICQLVYSDNHPPYVLWLVWQKLCQYRQHRASNTHRAEPIENALMIDPIKGCTEINLRDPSLLPTL